MKSKNRGRQEVSKTNRSNAERRLLVAQQKTFSGPIPPPDILREYNDIIPNAAERIMRVFEGNSSHKIEMQKLSLDYDMRRDRRGQWMSFVVMLVTLALAGASIMYADAVAPQIIMGLVALLATVKVLYGYNNKNTEKPEKSEKKDDK